MRSILKVTDLAVSFHTHHGEVQAVRGVDFSLQKGETVAMVGESGCGKSVTAQAIMRLTDRSAGERKRGQILFNDQDLVQVSEKEMAHIRGAEIAMIFQDPMTSLNPTLTIGEQIMEGLIRHRKINKRKAKERAIEWLRFVGIPTPDLRLKQYPHQLSGGMRQRVMIAIALSLEPKVLIADEPTTALDVTIQAQILDLMKRLKEQTDTSILLITHDLGVVAETADHVFVVYSGQVMETAPIEEIFVKPRHPYTWGLIDSMPRLQHEKNHVLQPIPGTPPDLLHPPIACPFVTRCSYAMNICTQEMPPLLKIKDQHQVACWLNHPQAPAVRPAVGEGGEDQ